ncbi:MAG: hypothetical protein ACLUOF_06825 [Ruminococcus sp.]
MTIPFSRSVTPFVRISMMMMINIPATVKLDSVSVQDNFDGLPAVDDIGNPVDYSQYLNADGTVKDDVRTWYSRGDGVNTLDEKVKEETVPQRVLVMHLSYTNESSITQEICVCPNLLQKNGDRLITAKLPASQRMKPCTAMAHWTT